MPSLQGLNPRSFEEVRAEVAARHERRYPDKVIELKRVTVTENLHVRVPGVGILEMTDWAKTQIGSSLGIKWDKWFATRQAGTVITAAEIQQELQRRFNRLPGMVRMVRSRRHETTRARSDGVLEAFLGPLYEPIDDERVFARLESRFADRVEALRVIQRPIAGDWDWGWGNDRTSHYVFLTGEAEAIGTLEDGEPDWHHPGFYLRNSEVGAASLTMDDFWFRTSSGSGLLGVADKEHLLRRTHRRIEDQDIDDLLRESFEELESRHRASLDLLMEARHTELEDPPDALERYLRARGAPKRTVEAVVTAWEGEPGRNRFAGIQAITRAAKDMRDPDRRYEFEHLAGRFNFWVG
jgi:hypothetical protein